MPSYAITTTPQQVATAGQRVSYTNSGPANVFLTWSENNSVRNQLVFAGETADFRKPTAVMAATNASTATLTTTVLNDPQAPLTIDQDSAVRALIATLTGALVAGNYYIANGQTTPASSAALGNNVLRLCPWLVPNSITLARIGAEVSAAGAAGSVLRLGIYADNGYGQPSILVLDAGTIDATVVGVAELTVNLPLSAGPYWIGGAVQNAAGGQPTVRTPGTGYTPPLYLGSTSAPGTAANLIGYQQAAQVSGALPTTLSALTVVGTAPRVFVKA